MLDRRAFIRAAGNSTIASLNASLLTSMPIAGEDGQAIWTRNDDGPQAHPLPAEGSADIWVFTGQSNSQGWGMLKAPVQSDPRVFFFNANNQWVVAREPLNPRFTSWVPDTVRENIRLQRNGVNFPSGAATDQYIEQMELDRFHLGGVGAGTTFARHLVRYLDRPIGLVYCGVGGSPIKSWDPSVKDSNYAAMMKRIRMVGGRIRGLVWYQGESDAMSPGAEDVYESALLNLIDSIRKDTDTPDLPILCVQLARFVWNYDSHSSAFEKIRDIQRRLPKSRKGVFTVSAIDLPLEDAAHISFEAQLRLGRRLAKLALNQVYSLPGQAGGISLRSIEVIKPATRRPMIRVRFDGVMGRLKADGLPTGFEIRSVLPASEPVDSDPGVLMPVVYRVDFDPFDPCSVILGVFDNVLISTGGAKFHPLQGPFSLVYGPGMSPYVNIVDEQDMPVPAFGPVLVGK